MINSFVPKDEPWDHRAESVPNRHWALFVIKDPLKYRKIGARSLNEFCRDHPEDPVAVQCALENFIREEVFVNLCLMGDNAEKVRNHVFPVALALKTCVYPLSFNIKLLAGYLIQTELDTYTLRHEHNELEMGSWETSQVKDGTLTTSILQSGNFDKGLGFVDSGKFENVHCYFWGQRFQLGRAYQILIDSMAFHSDWNFADTFHKSCQTLKLNQTQSKQDLKKAFEVKTLEGLSVRPSNLIGITKLRHILTALLANTPVTPFEINVILIFMYCRFVDPKSRQDQAKAYQKYLREQDEDRQVESTSQNDPFLYLKYLYRERVPLLPWFLEHYVPILW